MTDDGQVPAEEVGRGVQGGEQIGGRHLHSVPVTRRSAWRTARALDAPVRAQPTWSGATVSANLGESFVVASSYPR